MSVPPSLLTLTDDLTIYHVADLKVHLQQALSQAEGELVIELTHITEVDSAGLQLLLWLPQEAQRQQKTVIYTQPSHALRELCALYHIKQELPLLAGENIYG